QLRRTDASSRPGPSAGAVAGCWQRLQIPTLIASDDVLGDLLLDLGFEPVSSGSRGSAARRPCIRKPKLFQQRAEASSKFRANGCGLAPSLGRGLAIACLYRLGKTAPLLQTRCRQDAMATMRDPPKQGGSDEF